MNLKFLIIMMLVLVIAVVAIPNVLWLIGWIIGKCCGFRLSYKIFGYAACVLAIAVVGIVAYGYFVGRFQLQVTDIEYCNSNIPESFDGYKIVHISDLHLSTFDDQPCELQRFIDTINAQKPDIICFTGDLVSIGVNEARKYVDLLRQLCAKNGVVSVLGNHDMLIYNWHLTEAERIAEVERLSSFERDTLGWTLLRNAHVTIERNGETLTFVGVDNTSCANQGFKTIRSGDLKAAMQGTDGFRILLSHDPTHWRAEVVEQTDIPLTLSGHTHSAQIRLFGWTPAVWSFDDVAGRYDEGNQTLYINVGLGCTAPVRIGCPAEITTITLKKE